MTDLNLRRLKADAPGFNAELDALLAWEAVSDSRVVKAVADIIAAVKDRGDVAVLDYTRQFDGSDAASLSRVCACSVAWVIACRSSSSSASARRNRR